LVKKVKRKVKKVKSGTTTADGVAAQAPQAYQDAGGVPEDGVEEEVAVTTEDAVEAEDAVVPEDDAGVEQEDQKASIDLLERFARGEYPEDDDDELFEKSIRSILESTPRGGVSPSTAERESLLKEREEAIRLKEMELKEQRVQLERTESELKDKDRELQKRLQEFRNGLGVREEGYAELQSKVVDLEEWESRLNSRESELKHREEKLGVRIGRHDPHRRGAGPHQARAG